MTTRTRRAGAAVAALGMVAATILALAAAPVGADQAGKPPPAPPAGPVLAVAGPFTGTGTLTTECSVFHQVVNGSGDWTALGASTLLLDFCTASDQGTNHWPIYAAGFTITAADGGQLTGDMSGFVEAGGFGPEFPLHFTLTVTGGTGSLAGATGSIAMEGAFGFAAATVHGTVDGSVTLPPPTPASAQDCKSGGWRDLVDDHGDGFANQGDCVAWANHHLA
ncbi:MAG TPA: hypothetical protein VKB57_24120 [Acidimicrobiales bacterium]|nr:hypothetical protein [Acidimicrobiales bacterium]